MSGYFYITCKKDGKVLDCEGKGKPAALTALTTREKEHGRNTQLWKWDSKGRLLNKADNKLVADINEKKKEAGTPVILWSPTGKPNQKWTIRKDSIHSELNGLVMDASTSSVKMNRPGKSEHQTFEFIPEEIEYFYIISEKYEKVLDSADGHILTTSPINGTDTQLWRWDGNCLVNKLGFVADIKEASEGETRPILLTSHSGTQSQQWKEDHGNMRSMLSKLVMETRDNAVEMRHSLNSPSQMWKIDPDKNRKPMMQYFYVVSEKDGQVLDSKKDTLEQELIVSPKSGRKTQLWRWDSTGYKLINKLGLVAEVKNHEKETRVSVILWSPTGDSNQRWQHVAGYIRSEFNDLVMSIWNSQITMGIPSDENAQKWKLIPEEDLNNCFYVLNEEDGKALVSTSDQEGGQLITSELLRHSSQMWKWDSEGRLVSNTGLVADIKGQSAEAGDQVVLSAFKDASNQRWEEDGDYIKSKHNNLVMGSWKSELMTELDFDAIPLNPEITVQQPADRPSQKWKFLYEDHHTSSSGYFFVVNLYDRKVLDSGKNEPREQLITFTALRRATQLWRWDSEGRLVNKAGLVADVKQKNEIQSLITQAQFDPFQKIQKAGDPVVLKSPNGNSNQVWRVEENVIKSCLNDLAMDASGSRVTVISVSNSLAQKWDFVPEDLWGDYELMLESRNPLSETAFSKKVAEDYLDVIIGFDIDEYRRKIPDAIEVVNECADRLAKKDRGRERDDDTLEFLGDLALSAGSALLSASRKAAFAAGSIKTLSFGIVEQKWSKQEIQGVKDVIKPLFGATMCLQGFISRYIEKLKTVNEYLETEEGKEIAEEASSISEKVFEEDRVAWNEDKMGDSIVTSTKHVEQAKQINHLVEYVGASGATFASRSHLAAGTTSAKILTRSLAGFGIAFGIWDAVDDFKDINEERELAKEFRQTAETLKKESDRLIELYFELFLRSELTVDGEIFPETSE